MMTSVGYPIPLSVDELMAKAREVAGVNIVDHEVVEPLTILHRSLSLESRMHREGAIGKQRQLIRLLANRLRMARDFAAHPEIAEQPLKGPVVIFGMARSGTTKTQKVLAASGDFNFLPFWQVHNPASFTGKPNESTDARIREADDHCRWVDKMSPEAKLGHGFETFEPEEDSWLTEQSFISSSFTGYAEVPSYVEWFAKQSALPTFELVRDVLKYLQWQGLASPEKTWLLKSPTYYGFEREMMQVFPNARVVMTHRSPLRTLPSACKLANCVHKPYCDALVDVDLFAGGFAGAMNQHLTNRAALPSMPLLDLSFEDIHRSLGDVMGRIYEHIGLPLSDGSRQRMRQWELDHPQHKEGKFHYSLEEFGLDEAKVRGMMPRYFAFLESAFGKVPG